MGFLILVAIGLALYFYRMGKKGKSAIPKPQSNLSKIYKLQSSSTFSKSASSGDEWSFLSETHNPQNSASKSTSPSATKIDITGNILTTKKGLELQISEVSIEEIGKAADAAYGKVLESFQSNSERMQGAMGIRSTVNENMDRIASAFQNSVLKSIPDDLWIPPGKDILFHKYIIPNGMVYFGENLSSVKGWGPEPALINQKLKINSESPDQEARFMNYWPSYNDINPSCRAAYLEWLATGKSDPKANIGYVFIYFYGLERRILHDSKTLTAAQAEIPLLLEEIKRLLSIYKNDQSFNTYATNLINAVQAIHLDKKLYADSLPSFNKGFEYPLNLKIALGQLAVDGVSVPVEWALAWVKCDPSYYPRTPARRCPEEFEKLFRHKYAEKFGNGCVIKPNKTKIKISYLPASRTFNGAVEFKCDDLPDVTVVKRPNDQLKEISEQCTDELDAYSRYLGRKPGDTKSPAALALLPKGCLNGKNDQIQSIADWLQRTVSSDYVQIDIFALLQFFPSLKLESITKKDSLAIAQLLAKFGVGIEPDVRFGGNPYKPGPVILFKLPLESFSSPTPEYSTATVVLLLAAMVAHANGTISPEEEHYLNDHLLTWLDFKEGERARARAYTKWLLAVQPDFSRAKKKIQYLATSDRLTIGKFLVSLAQSDGFIDADEMKMLSKIYALLGLDIKDLYSQAHSAAAQPVTVKLEDKTITYAIPTVFTGEKTDGVELDMVRIKAKMAETVEVSAILKDIFAEDTPLPSMPVVKAQDGIEIIPGLDSEYSFFASRLIKKNSWSRDELEQLASEMDILLDGTFEAINDAAFESFGEAFLEGDDPIELNTRILEEINK